MSIMQVSQWHGPVVYMAENIDEISQIFILGAAHFNLFTLDWTKMCRI